MSVPELEELLGTAEKFLESGNAPEAIQCYARIVELDSENDDAWYMLGALQGEVGMIDQGLDSIARSLQINPDSGNAWLSQAYLQHAKGGTEEAMRSGLRAVAIDIELAEAWLFLGSLAGQLGKFEEAENCSSRALGLEPDNPEAYAIHGNALYQLKKTEEAEDAFRSAIKIDPGNCSGLMGLVILLMSRFRIDEANEYLQQLMQNCPGVENSMSDIGTNFLEGRNTQAAISIFKSLLQAGHESAGIHYNLAKAYITAGRNDDAVASLEKALACDPELAEAKQLLAVVTAG